MLEIPAFGNSQKLRVLVFEAEENLIDNIEQFAKSFDEFEILEKLELKIKNNKLKNIPAFSNSQKLEELLFDAEENLIDNIEQFAKSLD